MILFSIKDVVAVEFGPIFEAKNEGVGIRNYIRMVNDNKLNIEEFVLYKVGEMDKELGNISMTKVVKVSSIMLEEKEDE